MFSAGLIKSPSYLKAGANYFYFLDDETELRIALTEHSTAMFQAELWSQFRVGGCVDMSVERP